MRTILRALPLLLALPATQPLLAQDSRAEAWWAHVEYLASDELEGRLTGSPGFDKAADYVIAQFKALGLQPAGVKGYVQPVALTEQKILWDKSSAALVAADGTTTALSVPTDMAIGGRGGPPPPPFDAPMVFAGYGLHMPEAGHDDFAGLDLKGKVVIVISGGPATISAALKSHARSERSTYLADRGALGVIELVTPKQVEIPWARRVALSSQAGMYFTDPALRDSPTPFFAGSVDPAKSAMLFAGSGQDYAAIAAAADASKPVAGFPLALRLKAAITVESRPVAAKNIIARLPGSDPKLKAQNVVLSAHLDGLGVGTPINGDAIYNGALDNASGVASLIEIARSLRADKAKPKRTLIFAIVSGEEKGLLGARFFARRPTVPQKSLVADLNFDMALPIFKLTAVTPLGYDQSSLGKDAQAVGATMGLPILPDPFPDRNTFIRSDQYAFIREGIPSLFFKYGFKAGTPEAEVEKAWRANIYHSPADDAKQPVMAGEAVKMNDYVAALTMRIADAPERPTWNADSFFKRFAK